MQVSYTVVEMGFSAECILLTPSLQEFCEIVCVCVCVKNDFWVKVIEQEVININ